MARRKGKSAYKFYIYRRMNFREWKYVFLEVVKLNVNKLAIFKLIRSSIIEVK